MTTSTTASPFSIRGRSPSGSPTRPGLNHVAFTFEGLDDLIDNYQRLQALGIRPHRCVNHGVTTSMYYHDPDQNQVELLVDNFATAAAGRTYMQNRSRDDKNPVGIVFDPEELVERVRARTAHRGTGHNQQLTVEEANAMPAALPALNLVAPPGERRATLDLAREIERRGFAGIQVSSQYSNMAQCIGLAFATERISFATAIAPIYAATTEEFAGQAAYLHEVSGGRFQFGIGIAHAPLHERLGVTPGRPLADIRAFVAALKAFEGIGALPPIVLAALRRRMVALAGEIGDGVVFANASRAHMAASLDALPADKRSDPNFFIANRIRTCIAEDEAEAKAVLRRTVTHYALMPNYRNYWKEAGYFEEMTAVETAVAEGRVRRDRQVPLRSLALRHRALRAAGKDPRRGRGLAGGRRAHAGAGAAFGRRQAIDRDPAGLRRLRRLIEFSRH